MIAGITQKKKKTKKLYFHCGPSWKMKKENFSAGKCSENDEKAIESRLTKKRDSFIEIFVKRTIKT